LLSISHVLSLLANFTLHPIEKCPIFRALPALLIVCWTAPMAMVSSKLYTIIRNSTVILILGLHWLMKLTTSTFGLPRFIFPLLCLICFMFLCYSIYFWISWIVVQFTFKIYHILIFPCHLNSSTVINCMVNCQIWFLYSNLSCKPLSWKPRTIPTLSKLFIKSPKSHFLVCFLNSITKWSNGSPDCFSRWKT